jgi:putative FmdB family regulatory protein
MPLYEYQCHECDTHYERIEKASAPTDGVCPECGGAARRLLGAPALQFKGSGWYVNDYGKRNGSAPSAANEPKQDSKSETTSKTTSETTSDSTTKTESPSKNDSKVA